MDGDQKLSALGIIFGSFCVIALIGGCTVVAGHIGENERYSKCIAARMEWKQGSCVEVVK